MIELGVNIDHVATVRQARRTHEPDPVTAAAMAELGGADGITFHLREDRRHIQDRDVEVLMKTVSVKTNFELACADDVLQICCRARPTWALLVPENRAEVTTEGGLNVTGDSGRIAAAVRRLKDHGIRTSLFLDPDLSQVEAAAELGVDAVELHTGPYANAADQNRAGEAAVATELQRIVESGRAATAAGMRLHAGHGLNYQNVREIAAVESMAELNIGHSIVSRAVMVGMQTAVSQMRRLIDEATPAAKG